MTLICLDCRYIRPKPSGIGMIARQLVHHLPEIAPEWTFLFLRSSELKERLSNSPNVREVEVSIGANSPASMWFLPEWVDLRGIDLFHSVSNTLPARLSMPSVTTVHDLMWLTQPELCNPRPWGQIERLFYQHGMRRALRRSDAIIAVSETTRADIMAYDPSAGKKTRAILSGVSEDFRPQSVPSDLLSSLGLLNGEYFLTVGQNAPYKNHETAIRGFARAFADHPHMQLVLVQRRGPRNGALARLSEKLLIKDRVHFVEPVDDDTLVKLYCGALALLHPSICEGFGMPLAEAMACGCPVITSDRSAMPEVAGAAALLVDPFDSNAMASALQQIATDAELRESLSAKGLARAEQLSWRQCAEQHIEVYRQVLEGA